MKTARIVWCVGIAVSFTVLVLSDVVPGSARTALVVSVCFVCELMDSTLGMGYGTTLTPILLFAGYEPVELVPTILTSELASGLAAAAFHHQHGNVVFRRGSPHLRFAAILSIGSVAGVAVGVKLAISIPKQVLTIVIGGIILVAGIAIWRRIGKTQEPRSWKMVLLATVASFNKAVSGGGYGPLLTSGQVLSGVEGRAAVAITSLSEAFTCLVGVLLFLLAGKHLTVELLVPVVTGSLLSVPVSASLVRRVPDSLLRRGIALFTVGFGLLVLVKGLAD